MSLLYDYLQSISEFSRPKVAAYPWDEWLYTDYFYHETPELVERFKPLTGLACRACCIAVGEWIANRLREAPRIENARHYFDAAWVTEIHQRALVYAELSRSEWAGPYDGPLRAAMLIVNDTAFEAEDDFFFAERVCWSMNLAHHIADDTDRSAFDQWIDRALERLVAFHSGPVAGSASIFDRSFNFGDPVGPGLFILSRPYDPSQNYSDIARIANAGVGSNPYLRLTEPL